MKKQLFIALLVTTLTVTAIPAAALTAANAATNTAPALATPAATSTGAITKTITSESAIKTTDSAIKNAATESASSDPTTQKATTATDSTITTESNKNQTPEATTTATESLAPVTLSLDGAYKKMLSDSPQAILAKYTMDSELSVAKGYSEKISSMNKEERETDRIAGSWGIDTSNKPMLQAQKDFGKIQAPKNYEASINQLKSETYEKYYNYKYTEAQVQVAKENLARTQEVYSSTMLKYKLGNVSRLDTLTAETSLNTAKDEYALKINEFETEKMNFNLFMGYGIHHKVTLTDSLVPLSFPSKSLEASVKDAKVNRNEISEANYNVRMAQYAMDNVKDYPSSSATYMSAKTVLLMAQEAAKTKPETIEVDVRTKYMDMKQKYDTITSGKVSYENSKEASRLSQLQYDSGLITVTELSETNLKTFEAQQAYYKAILDYNLAVDVYVLSSGIGTKTASIN